MLLVYNSGLSMCMHPLFNRMSQEVCCGKGEYSARVMKMQSALLQLLNARRVYSKIWMYKILWVAFVRASSLFCLDLSYRLFFFLIFFYFTLIELQCARGTVEMDRLWKSFNKNLFAYFIRKSIFNGLRSKESGLWGFFFVEKQSSVYYGF